MPLSCRDGYSETTVFYNHIIKKAIMGIYAICRSKYLRVVVQDTRVIEEKLWR